MTNRFTLPGRLLLLLFIPVFFARTQVLVSSPGITDSIAQSSSHPDSVFMLYDSTGRMSLPVLVGSYDRNLDSTSVISREQLHWMEYRSLAGILEQYPGVFLRNQYSEGQYSQLSIRGTDWRGIAITLDGRLLNDPASGIYNPFYFSTEYADRIEVVTGPRAFLYGLNSTGGAINLVTKNYNSNRPFSKLNYSESGYNYSYTDGTFSQNISRKINVTLGFQQQSTDGRFENSEHEQWNGRVKLRYNVSKSLNIILSDYFTHTQTGLNGGVDIAASGIARAFNPLLVTMVNSDSYEKVTRHDADLSLVGTLFDDTTDVSLLSFYYSRSIREYRDEENRPNANGVFVQSDHVSSWMGVMLRQNFDMGIQRFDLGANLEIRQIEGSPNLGRRRNVIGSVWGIDELLISERITVAGYARYDHYLRQSFWGFGGDARLIVGKGLTVFGGVSSSRRMPTYPELYWSDSSAHGSMFLEGERHVKGEVGIDVHADHVVTVRASGFHEIVDDQLRVVTSGAGTIFQSLHFKQADQFQQTGIEVAAGVRVGWLSVEGMGMILFQHSVVSLRDYPRTSASGGIYFWDKILEGKLDLKVGFRGRYLSSHYGATFNPEVLAYSSEAGTSIGAGGSVDFQATARIGDAYIQLIWENLTNQHYFTTPYYPVLDREVRFGLSWQFLD